MLSLGLMIGLYAISASTSNAQALYFYIENQTGFTLNEINVTPAETSTWGSDILPNDLFANNTRVEVNIPASYGETCFFDIRITDLEGNAVIYSNIDACKLLTITVYADGTATIVNE